MRTFPIDFAYPALEPMALACPPDHPTRRCVRCGAHTDPYNPRHVHTFAGGRHYYDTVLPSHFAMLLAGHIHHRDFPQRDRVHDSWEEE